MAKAASACGRDPDSIGLIAVGKTKPLEKVREAILCGVTHIGENYIQEAKEKFTALSSYDVLWHFIGHLQTNKAKYAVRIFDLIHTVDTLKLARELHGQAKKINKVQKVLVQVNVGGEDSKSGSDPGNTLTMIREMSELENLSVRGLMTLPPFFDDPKKVRPFFSSLNKLSREIRREDIPNIFMDHLSMGMTGDFETAIEEGATLIRIGTAIFGKRN